MFSNTLSLGKMLVIWNERDRPGAVDALRRPAVDRAGRRRAISPARRREVAGDQVEQRRLAGAVGSDQRVALAGVPGRGRRRG